MNAPPPSRLAEITRGEVLSRMGWGGLLLTVCSITLFAASEEQRRYVPFVLPFCLMYATTLALLGRRQPGGAAAVMIAGNVALLVGLGWGTGGLYSPTVLYMAGMPVLAGLVSNGRVVLAVNVVFTVAVLAMAGLGDRWWLVAAPEDMRLNRAIAALGTMWFLGWMAHLASRAITQALEASEQREKDNERARRFADHLLRSLPTPVAITDAAGRPVDANDAARRLLGVLDGAPLPAAPLTYEPLPGGLPDEQLLLLPQGGAVPVHLTQTEIHDPRGQELKLWAFSDLSPRIALEAESARAAEVAREASAAKSRFLATMSHELRTPLNAILGYAELVAEDAEPDARADLERITKAGRHLLGLINDVLDISRIEAGRLDLVIAEFDVAEVLGQIADLARPLVLEKGNRFVVDLGEALGRATTDERRVRQVCANLLANAARHTVGRTVTLRGRREEDMIVVEVADEGEGIAASQLPRLFELFTRLNEAAHPGGAGLGLAISRRLAEQLGGTLTAASTLGQGSTFTFTWKTATARSGSPAADASLSPSDPPSPR